MDMEGILAITFIFGGGSLFLLAISPIGKAIANRIQGGPVVDGLPADAMRRIEAAQQSVLEEVDALRHELVDMQERLDFAERILAKHREAPRLGGGADSPNSESSG
ncbi:MAG: hypothetical protein WD934_06150 [Gemmatimonadales bacterium]